MARFDNPETIYVNPDGTASATDPRIRNPNVGASGSPEAQAFRAQQAAGIGPQPQPGMRGVPPPGGGMADRINGMASSLNETNARQAAAIRAPIDAATQGVKNFSAGVRNVGGAVGNLAAAAYNNPLIRIGGGVLGGISSLQDAHEAQAAFDRGDNTQGIASGVRSVAGAASMAPGPIGLLGTAYMGGQLVGSGIDKGLQQFEAGRKLRDQIGGLFATSDERFKVGEAERFADSLKNNTPFVPGTPPTARSVAAPTPVAQPAPVTADGMLTPEQRAARLQQAAEALGNGAANTSGLVSRQGNSFSGKNIREGFSYEDGPGSRPSTGTVSVVGNGGGYGFGPNSSLGGMDAALAAARSAAADRGDFSMVGGSAPGPTPGLGGFGGATLSSDLRAKTDAGGTSIRDLMRAGLSAQQAQQAVTAAEDRAERARSADLGAATQRYGTDVGANVATRGQDIGATTSIRGQDMTFAANRANNRLAVWNAQREQANADRTFKAGRDDANFTHQQQATKDLHDQIASWIPPVLQDGKQVPDMQTAQRYAVGVQTAVGRMGKTMRDLDDSDKSRLIQGMQLADIASGTATNGMTPWGTKAIRSNEPILALQKLPDGNYRTNRLGLNKEQEIIPARFVEKEGSLFGMQYFGTPSNRFQGLVQGAAK